MKFSNCYRVFPYRGCEIYVARQNARKCIVCAHSLFETHGTCYALQYSILVAFSIYTRFAAAPQWSNWYRYRHFGRVLWLPISADVTIACRMGCLSLNARGGREWPCEIWEEGVRAAGEVTQNILLRVRFLTLENATKWPRWLFQSRVIIACNKNVHSTCNDEFFELLPREITHRISDIY